MAKIFNGMIPFASAIQPTGAQPLDDRVVVATLADLTDATTFGDAKYNGMLVAVTETQQVYMLVDDVNSTSSDAWVQVGKETDLTEINTAISGLNAKLNVANNSGLDATSALKVKIDSTVEGNILQVSENGLSVVASQSEYSLDAVTTPAEGYASQYEFKKDGEVVTTINIPKDQFLKSATFHATAEEGVSVQAPYLKFVWDIAGKDMDPDLDGIQNTTYVPVADLVDTYTEGSYITIQDNVISVDESALDAHINGLKVITDLQGVVDIHTESITTFRHQINNPDNGIIVRLDNYEGALSEFNGTLSGHTSSISTLTTDVNGLKTSLTNYKVKDVDDTQTNGIGISLTEGTIKANVDLATLTSVIITDDSVNATTVKLVSDIKDSDTEEDRYESGTSVESILANLNVRINEIDADIQGALAGGVTNVGAGNGISVNSDTATKPIVSIKVAANSALKATTDGLDIY